MTTISKTTFFLFTLLLSLTSSQALRADSVVWNEYRREVKDMAVKNHKPLTSYSDARRYVMQKLALKNDSQGYYITDVYCRQVFRRSVGPNKMPPHTSINIEHTWPQSRFNRAKSKSMQKADLHHLFPSESSSNSMRGNHYFAEVEDGGYPDSDCRSSSIGLDPETGDVAFEPPADHKGNVARALFYFSIRYDIAIPNHEELFLRIWNYSDPVDENEMRRNAAVESIQGNRNPFIDDPGLVELIENF